MGWEPQEVHVHEYDDLSRVVRTTVTRQPEWDDREREKMLALVEYESKVCECGMHETIADTDPDLEMVERICPVCAGLAQSARLYADRDEKTMKPHGDHPAASIPRPNDGRHLSVRLVPRTE